MGQETTSSAKKYFEENDKEYTTNALLSHFSRVQLCATLWTVVSQPLVLITFLCTSCSARNVGNDGHFTLLWNIQ